MYDILNGYCKSHTEIRFVFVQFLLFDLILLVIKKSKLCEYPKLVQVHNLAPYCHVPCLHRFWVICMWESMFPLSTPTTPKFTSCFFTYCLPCYEGYKMEVLGSSNLLAPNFQSTWLHNTRPKSELIFILFPQIRCCMYLRSISRKLYYFLGSVLSVQLCHLKDMKVVQYVQKKIHLDHLCMSFSY